MMPVLANLDPLAVADSRISRRIFVRRKSAERLPASRNRRLKCSAKYQPEKNRPITNLLYND